MNPEEDHLPYNVYRPGTKTELLVNDGRAMEYYQDGLLHREGKNVSEELIKDNIYKLSGYLPAIHWLDGKLDCYYIHGRSIENYPYTMIYIENGKKKYFNCNNWELKEKGII